jgi:putative N6-adenine-specific DNA methylase
VVQCQTQTIRVDVTAVKCPLKSLEFITLRIKDAICDRFRADVGKRPSVDTREPDVRMHGFLTADECTLYIDTSGAAALPARLRQKTVEAPLKENVAAGILRLSGWQPGTPLLDPMCGSGTFLLEAAQMALNIAPGAGGRSFGFQRLKNFSSKPGNICSTAPWTPKNLAPMRRSTAATFRQSPCAPRWPTLTAPACCLR